MVVAPRYVVLAGDATFDPRDYAAFGPGDFVPTKLVDMDQTDLETASDDWFVDVNLDGVPEVAIGRLPVRTAAQAAAVVAKLTSYDADPGGAWAKNITLVTDTDDPATHFRASSAQTASRLPGAYTPHPLDTDLLGAAAVKAQVFDLVAQGQLIVNYLGHGSERIWGSSGELLHAYDIAAGWAAAGSRLPFVVAMNCLNGFFQGIYDEGSLAERLLRADAGAVAVWASSSLTEAEEQRRRDPARHREDLLAVVDHEGQRKEPDRCTQGRHGEGCYARTSSRLASIMACVVASRLSRSIGSVFDARTLKCQSGNSAEMPSSE